MFAENRSDFFSNAELAVEGVYKGTITILGYFDHAYAESAVATIGIQERRPQFLCDEADIDADPQGQTLVIGSLNYRILRQEPDGTGMTLLVLENG